VFDAASLEANRHGQLSRTQRTFVFRVGLRWVLSAMFLTAFGLLAVFVVDNFWFRFVGSLLIGLAAAYLVLRSLDCIFDCSHDRVALVTGQAIPRQPEMLDFPVTGWKEEGWLRASVNDLWFWLPPEAVSASGEISVYFVPRSRVAVNVEPAN